MTAATADERPTTRARGTTNTNVRGSSYDRRKRREWLCEIYRADVDVLDVDMDQLASLGVTPLRFEDGLWVVPQGQGDPACRCYRCGRLLTVDSVSPDRILPGCRGGRYTRDNIRPACEPCQSFTGGVLGNERKRALKAVRS